MEARLNGRIGDLSAKAREYIGLTSMRTSASRVFWPAGDLVKHRRRCAAGLRLEKLANRRLSALDIAISVQEARKIKTMAQGIPFRVSFVTEHADLPIPSVPEALTRLKSGPSSEDLQSMTRFERLVFIAKIEEGLAQLDRRERIPHSEAKRRLRV